jgi:ABC-type amino acid transport substrate-binding protein
MMHKYSLRNIIGGIHMKRKIALLTAVAIFIISCLSLAGCGSDKDSNKGMKVKVIDIPLTQEEYAFGVDKNQPELLEEVNKFIKEIQSNGKFDEICDKYFGEGTPEPVTSAELDESKDQLVVATNAAFEPFEYMAGDKYLGIDMEIAALLAEHLGKELVISNMDFDAVCLSVGQSKADIAMAGLTIKEDRKEYVNFSDKYYDASQTVIVKANDKRFDNCKTAEDVEKILSELPSTAKIGVQTGTTGQFYVEGDADWGFDGFNVQCIGYKSGSLAVQDMLNGNLDLVIIDEAPAKHITAAINELN